MDCFPASSISLEVPWARSFPSAVFTVASAKQMDRPARMTRPSATSVPARAMPRLVTDRSREVYPWSSSMSQ